MSLNVNCLKSAQSRAGLIDLLKHHKPDLIALQEVNLNTEELSLLVNACGYSAFSNIDITNPHVRGTAMLWKNSIASENITVVQEDCMIFLDIGGMKFINLYAPSGRNKRQERQVFFGETLERVIRNCGKTLPIIIGDYNVYFQT